MRRLATITVVLSLAALVGAVVFRRRGGGNQALEEIAAEARKTIEHFERS